LNYQISHQNLTGSLIELFQNFHTIIRVIRYYTNATNNFQKIISEFRYNFYQTFRSNDNKNTLILKVIDLQSKKYVNTLSKKLLRFILDRALFSGGLVW
jgi:hypothetical protein